jgi:hypothetical protein
MQDDQTCPKIVGLAPTDMARFLPFHNYKNILVIRKQDRQNQAEKNMPMYPPSILYVSLASHFYKYIHICMVQFNRT